MKNIKKKQSELQKKDKRIAKIKRRINKKTKHYVICFSQPHCVVASIICGHKMKPVGINEPNNKSRC